MGSLASLFSADPANSLELEVYEYALQQARAKNRQFFDRMAFAWDDGPWNSETITFIEYFEKMYANWLRDPKQFDSVEQLWRYGSGSSDVSLLDFNQECQKLLTRKRAQFLRVAKLWNEQDWPDDSFLGFYEKVDSHSRLRGQLFARVEALWRSDLASDSSLLEYYSEVEPLWEKARSVFDSIAALWKLDVSDEQTLPDYFEDIYPYFAARPAMFVAVSACWVEDDPARCGGKSLREYFLWYADSEKEAKDFRKIDDIRRADTCLARTYSEYRDLIENHRNFDEDRLDDFRSVWLSKYSSMSFVDFLDALD